MFSRTTFAFLVFSFSFSAGAQSPVDTDREELGYASYPVLQCPATNEAIKDFRTKLQDLKKSIKSQANCTGISSDVSGLADLVTNQRDDVLGLISKGQSEGLTTAEQGKVESYVQQLTEKTSNLVSVITGNDACFDEDKQGNSLEFITSLIGEGSKILSVIGGPEIGATIQVAGEVITGFLKAMKTIQNNRQGYKFAKADQRLAYAESLCSLFDYRRELEKLIAPYESVARLLELEITLNKQISVLRSNCVECAEIVSQVEREIRQARETKGAANFAIDDIWPKGFEAMVAARAKEIDQMYTRRVGTHTYRSLKTLTWIPLRIKALEDRNLSADLGLADVVYEMDSIEKFMVTEQATYFMKQLVTEAQTWQQKIVSHVTGARYTLYQLRASNSKVVVPNVNMWAEPTVYYGALLEALDVARDVVSSSDRALIRTYFADLEKLSRSLNIAVDVTNNYCEFFANAEWYKSGIRQHCGGTRLQAMNEAAAMFLNYRTMMPSYSKELTDMPAEPKSFVVSAPSEVVTQDWVESLTRVVEDLTQSQNYVLRQGTPTFH
jgi:hypothetical protein